MDVSAQREPERRPGPWRWLATMACVGAWLCPQPASALDFTRGPGAEGCIDAATLEARLQVVMGDGTDDERLRGRIEREGGGYLLRWRVRGAGERVLAEREVRATVADCRGLDDTIVVVAALMLDANPGVETPAPKARLHVGLGASVGSGPLPAPIFGGRLELSWSSGRLWLGAAFLAGRGSTIPALEGRLRSHLLWGEVFACGRLFGGERLGLGPCASLGAGRLVVRTEDLLGRNAGARLGHARAGLGARLRFDFSRRLRFWSAVGVDVALGRPRVSVEQGGLPRQVFRASLIGVRLDVGLSLRVP